MTPKIDMSTSKRIPDGPCVKCGDPNVTLAHVAARTRSHVLVCDMENPSREHFHHRCQRCGADWVTTDMLDGGTGS